MPLASGLRRRGGRGLAPGGAGPRAPSNGARTSCGTPRPSTCPPTSPARTARPRLAPACGWNVPTAGDVTTRRDDSPRSPECSERPPLRDVPLACALLPSTGFPEAGGRRRGPPPPPPAAPAGGGGGRGAPP